MSSSSSSSSSGGPVVFEESKFMKDLIHLRDTQEAIQGFSAWCIKHRKAGYKIARCWLKIVKKVKVEQKLTLFYLLNDIVQHCRRKNYAEFLSKFESVLKEALPHLKDDKINAKLLRCIHIWSERSVFSESFLEDIKSIINDDKDAEEIDNFQPSQLCTQIKIMKALEDDTDYKLKTLKDSEINIMDIEALRQTLKDRQDGNDFISDFEKSTSKMQDYIKAIDKELGKRRKVIELLTNGGKYYESLLGEANIVANAYTNFEKRLQNLKRKLGEKIPELEKIPPPPVSHNCSPIPSPDYDAPSPVNDEYELKLPGEENASDHPPSSIPHPLESAGKSSKSTDASSTTNGARDLNSRLHSMMSSSEGNTAGGGGLGSSASSSISNSSGSKTDKNFSISEFLTRLAEGKPVDNNKYSGPSSSNGYAKGSENVSLESPLSLVAPVAAIPSNPVQNPSSSHLHQSLSVQPHALPPPMPPVLPHAMSESRTPNKWWSNPPPPPPPPLPVPTPLLSSSSGPSWGEEPVPEWKLQDEDILEKEAHLPFRQNPPSRRETLPLSAPRSAYGLHMSSESLVNSSKNNLISLVSGPGARREVDMDVVDSDHEELAEAPSLPVLAHSATLSLQDRLKNLAGMPVSPPEENNEFGNNCTSDGGFPTPPSFPSPSLHPGGGGGVPWGDSPKKVMRAPINNNFHHNRGGGRGSPYNRGRGRGFHFDRDSSGHHHHPDRGRGGNHHRGFRGRW